MRRFAFSLVELLVCVAIIGVLLSLLLPAVQKVREAANRTKCMSSMRQVGLGVWLYQDAHGIYPPLMETVGVDAASGVLHFRHFYWFMRPYVEQADNDAEFTADIFLCAGRRSGVGPKGDYGVPELDYYSYYEVNLAGWDYGQCGLIIGYEQLRPQDIIDGTSCTLMLAHKGLDPKYYYNSIADSGWSDGIWRDAGWGQGDFNSNAEFDMSRWHLAFLRDNNEGYRISDSMFFWYPNGRAPCYTLMTSPHAGGMPCIAGDGSVRIVAYSKDYECPAPDQASIGEPIGADVPVLARLWSIRDGYSSHEYFAD